MQEKEKNLLLVQGQLDAYNRRDVDTFCSFFHQEVKVERLISNMSISGIAQFRANYKNLFESSPNLKCELKNRIVLENAIIDEEWVTGSSKNPAGVHAVAIYAFRDGLIDRVWFPG